MSSTAARVWPWVPAGLLLVMLSGLVTLARIASDDPGFALERNYYQKAVDYDRTIAQRRENARLGWRVTPHVAEARARAVTPVRIVLDGAGLPVAGARGRVEALRNASSARVVEAPLVEGSPGTYEASLALERGGLWELRLTFEKGADRFTHVARVDVPEAP